MEMGLWGREEYSRNNGISHDDEFLSQLDVPVRLLLPFAIFLLHISLFVRYFIAS